MTTAAKFVIQLENLRKLQVNFSKESTNQKLNCLAQLSKSWWTHSQDMLNYQDLLLFLAAYADNEKVRKAAQVLSFLMNFYFGSAN
jgi:hypothetical protein